MNLAEILEKTASNYPNDVCFILENQSKITFQSLLRRVNNLGNFLKNKGIKDGDNLIIWLPNTVEFAISLFASLKIGAVSILVNPAVREFEITYIMNDAKPKAIVTTEQLKNIYKEFGELVPQDILIISIDGEEWEKDLFKEPENIVSLKEVDLSYDTPAIIIYTGAVYGYPLGAIITHNNLLVDGEGIARGQGQQRGDMILAMLPYFHAFGLQVGMIVPIMKGIPTVLPRWFSPKTLFKMLTEYPITHFAGVPLMFGLLLKGMTPQIDLSKVKCWTSGGDKIPVEFCEGLQKFGIIVREGYGLTEASPGVSINFIDKQVKFGSIGTPLHCNEVKIVDDNGKEVPANTEGELIIKGPNVFKGYLNKPKETKEVLKEGWLYTGDLAKMDEDGYIFITGRKKRMLINNGLNVYPTEVENMMLNHPYIEKVIIEGIPDKLQGEIVKARIWLKEGKNLTKEELLEWCQKKFASYKHPKVIEFEKNL